MATLNKSDLAGEVSQESGLNTDDAKLAIEKLFELIARHLANGDEVNVPGFRQVHGHRPCRPPRPQPPDRRDDSDRRFPRHPSSRPPAP